MIGKPLDSITLHDLQSLIDNQVREYTSLDYKQALPGGRDRDKSEFLRDVVSFVNTAGGDLVFGVTERRDEDGKPTGEPERLSGVGVENQDALLLALEDMMRASIAPRLSGYQFKFVDLEEGRVVFILRLPQSLAAPHMLTFQTKSPFYARNSGGKFELDVQQIRDAFLQADALSERLTRFRQQRMALVNERTTPVPLVAGPTLMVHTLPLSGLRSGQQVDPSAAARQRDYLWPPDAYAFDYRYNFDGFLAFAPEQHGDPTSTAYTQTFRNGFVEYTSTAITNHEHPENILWSDAIEKDACLVVTRHLDFLRTMDVQLPAYVSLSLLNIAGYTLSPPPHAYGGIYRRRHYGFDRDALILPEVYLETFDQPIEQLLKPSFDLLWQAAGQPRSPYYDEQGNRMGF